MSGTTRSRVAAIALMILVLAGGAVATPAQEAGHDASRDDRGSVIAPLAFGGLAGLGLGVAYIHPSGEGWLLSDEAALPMAVAAGLATGLLVHATSGGGGESLGDGPRLRVAMGTGGDMDLDYTLGYRAPVRDRLEVEGTVSVTSHTWERVERETRCGMIIGCITGDFVTDHRYRQDVAIVLRGIYDLRPGAAWRPTLAAGGGLVAAHVDHYDSPPSRATGVVVDAALAVERGDRTRWSAEAGHRLVATAAGGEAGNTMSGPYLRLGVGLAAQPGARSARAVDGHGSDPRMWSLAATVLPILGGVALAAAGVGSQSEPGTALNASLIWGGALVGPGAGYVASGRGRRALPGIAARSAIFAVAWALAPTRDFDDGFLPNPSLDDAHVWLVAAPAIAVLDILDIVRAGRRPGS